MKDFKKYAEQAREDFAYEISKYTVSDNLALRTKADSLLIAFDQAVAKALIIDGVTNRFLAIAHYSGMTHKIHDVIELPSEEWKHADGTYCDAQYFLDYPDYFKKI